MKKTYNINLGGQAFVIDEDAYEMMSNYLQALTSAFTSIGSPEIVADIESRMQELFMERLERNATSILTITDVENVIERIGRPEDFLGEIVSEEKVETEEGVEVEVETQQPFTATSVPPFPSYSPSKKLFRDPRNKMLGGVCSGLAHYLGVDVVWVRLITAGLCFLSLSVVAIVYVILWIIVPEALTPNQRLQMMGANASVENIGRVVTDEFRSSDNNYDFTSEKPQSDLNKAANTFTQILGWCAKFIMIILGVILVPVVIMLTIGLGCALFALLVYNLSFLHPVFPQWIAGFDSENAWWTINGLWCAIGWIITVGTPICAFLWLVYNSFAKKQRPLTRKARISMLIIWVIGIILAAIYTSRVMIAP